MVKIGHIRIALLSPGGLTDSSAVVGDGTFPEHRAASSGSWILSGRHQAAEPCLPPASTDCSLISPHLRERRKELSQLLGYLWNPTGHFHKIDSCASKYFFVSAQGTEMSKLLSAAGTSGLIGSECLCRPYNQWEEACSVSLQDLL